MDGVPAPHAFKLWAAIFAVGAATERKTWTQLVNGIPVYANLFVWLVGPPGTGKTQAMVPMSVHLRKAGVTKLAPNDVSKQSLLDALKDAPGSVTWPATETSGPRIMEYHYLSMVIRELSNFMSSYDAALAGLLTDLFDNPPENDERKRTTKGAGPIIRPSVAMIAGTATRNLGNTVGGFWGQGFMSRIIMVYSADQPVVDFFQGEHDEEGEVPVREEFDPDLIAILKRVHAIKGRMRWSPEAVEAFKKWYGLGPNREGCAPFPKHSKLLEYNARRYLHATKLSMISALSDERMRIEEVDFKRALGWLESAEALMPEIFKEMATHSDSEVLRELHMHLWSEYGKQQPPRSKPFPATVLWSYLKDKVAAREIPRLIEAGENSALWSRVAGTQGPDAKYRPQANFGEIKVD